MAQETQETQDPRQLILDLELAELRSQNLNLGLRILDLEVETISQRQRIVELEAKLALEQRAKMRDQIVKTQERASADLFAAKSNAAIAFGLEDHDGLTSAMLKEG